LVSACLVWSHDKNATVYGFIRLIFKDLTATHKIRCGQQFLVFSF
jgi:hypothetical protein